MIEIRALLHAVALADHGSFVAAARAVHLSQPALSRSIKALEEQLGTPLFDRLAGAVRPTDAGAVFLDHARSLLGHAQMVEREIGLIGRVNRPEASLGAGTYCAEGLADIAIARLLGRRPSLRVRLVVDRWPNLLHALRRGDIDIVVADTTEASKDSALRVEPLSKVQGCFAVRPAHPLVEANPSSVFDIMAYPIVSTSRLTGRITEAFLHQAPANHRGVTAVPAIACESLAIMKSLARLGDAVAILPMRAMLEELEAGALRVLAPRPPWLYGEFGIITLRGRKASPLALLFAEELRAVDAQTQAEMRALERRLFSSTRDAQARTPAPSGRRASGRGSRPHPGRRTA